MKLILPYFIILLFLLQFYLKKNSKKTRSDNENFLKRESRANMSRKKDISNLNYITIPDTLPFVDTDVETIKKAQNDLADLKEKKILNLTGMSNTDLKIKYGVANKIDMELETPIFIENNENYDISLKMPNKPDDIIALASISREEITYPPADYNEKFRKIPETGDLERYVKANNKNLNEYALASVGFTKVSINEEITKAKIEILGIAYIMKRINMNKNKTVNASIAEKK